MDGVGHGGVGFVASLGSLSIFEGGVFPFAVCRWRWAQLSLERR